MQAIDKAIPPDLSVFRFQQLPQTHVRHGITGRAPALPDEGDFSYVTGSDPTMIGQNRRQWAAAIGIDADQLVCGRQVHGVRHHLVTRTEAGRGANNVDTAISGVDTLMTTEPGLPIAVLCADCVPILLYEPEQRAIAAVHAGWRGTTSDVAGEAVRAMISTFDVDPAHIIAGLGPSICPACYEVGPEVIDAWQASGLDPAGRSIQVQDNRPRPHFDLWTANVMALEAAGVPANQIEVAGICTRCNAERYFSRRAGTGHRGLFAAIIALV